MSTNINLFQKQYAPTILDLVEEYDHRYRRHGLQYSIALFYANDKSVDFNFFKDGIRCTDRFIAFEKNFAVFVFDNASGEGAIKAANNMLSKYEMKHFSQKVYASVASIDGYATTTELIVKAFHTIKFAVSEKMENVVVDEDDI